MMSSEDPIASTSTGASSSASAPAVPFFKKKSKKVASSDASAGTSSTKKRAISPSSRDHVDEERLHNRRAAATTTTAQNELEAGPSVVRLSRREAYNPLKQGSSAAKRRKQDELDGLDDGDADDDDAALLEHEKQALTVSYVDRRKGKRSGSAQPGDGDDNGESVVLSGDAALARSVDGATNDDGLYHGAANYKSALPKPGENSRFGPIKGPSASIRTITLVDYQPDVCKDYKETGWCGFGDSCKFLHMREDYLHGWEMDNAFLSNKPAVDSRLADAPPEEELPFACLICREPFGDAPHDPVVTRCNHYFGSSCAIKRFRKTPKCYACGASTGGIFNKATKLLERKEKTQKERIRQREEAERGQGGYLDDEEGQGGVEIEGLGEE